MKMSELIKALESHISRYGDIEVDLHIKLNQGEPVIKITDKK